MGESVAKLTAALCKARSDMGATVFKAGKNAHQNYRFVGHEQVMTSGAREALSSNGLALIQTSVRYISDMPGGKSQLWGGTFLLAHESGETLSIDIVATTQNNDKSAYVASTALDRTAHLRVLALAGSSEEDPEHDAHDKPAKAGKDRRTLDDVAAPANATVKEQTMGPAINFAQLMKELPIVPPEMLGDWFADLQSAKPSNAQKKEAWEAFTARCAEFEIDSKQFLKGGGK